MEEEITPAVVACGSEYTASITRRGQLLTWGLGSRGELGHELPHAGEVCHAALTQSLLITCCWLAWHNSCPTACTSQPRDNMQSIRTTCDTELALARHHTICNQDRSEVGKAHTHEDAWLLHIPNTPATLLNVQVNFPMRAILSASPDLRIVSVACGHSHTLAIAETGSVWSCGRNGDGQ